MGDGCHHLHRDTDGRWSCCCDAWVSGGDEQTARREFEQHKTSSEEQR